MQNKLHHLGSTSYITAKNGSISQHVEYIAFGEVLFEEHSSSFSSPYLFNGKELDRETGMQYHGQRYMDTKISQFYGLDKLTEKYPNYGGFIYALNNPIRFVDPSGLTPEDTSIDPNKGKLTGSKNLVIFTAENGIDRDKMNQDSGDYDWIAVKSPQEAEDLLKAEYGDKKGFIENLVWRSHGGTGEALLDVNPKFPVTDPSKVKSLHYIKELLTKDANVVFTACSLVGESLQPGKRYYEQGRNALDTFSDFFVKGSQRNLFLNYTLSSATNGAWTSLNFDVGLHKQDWAGFLWTTKDGVKPNFYDVKINSSGGISTQKMKWFMDFSHYKKPLYKN